MEVILKNTFIISKDTFVRAAKIDGTNRYGLYLVDSMGADIPEPRKPIISFSLENIHMESAAKSTNQVITDVHVEDEAYAGQNISFLNVVDGQKNLFVINTNENKAIYRQQLKGLEGLEGVESNATTVCIWNEEAGTRIIAQNIFGIKITTKKTKVYHPGTKQLKFEIEEIGGNTAKFIEYDIDGNVVRDISNKDVTINGTKIYDGNFPENDEDQTPFIIANPDGSKSFKIIFDAENAPLWFRILEKNGQPCIGDEAQKQITAADVRSLNSMVTNLVTQRQRENFNMGETPIISDLLFITQLATKEIEKQKIAPDTVVTTDNLPELQKVVVLPNFDFWNYTPTKIRQGLFPNGYTGPDYKVVRIENKEKNHSILMIVPKDPNEKILIFDSSYYTTKLAEDIADGHGRIQEQLSMSARLQQADSESMRVITDKQLGELASGCEIVNLKPMQKNSICWFWSLGAGNAAVEYPSFKEIKRDASLVMEAGYDVFSGKAIQKAVEMEHQLESVIPHDELLRTSIRLNEQNMNADISRLERFKQKASQNDISLTVALNQSLILDRLHFKKRFKKDPTPVVPEEEVIATDIEDINQYPTAELEAILTTSLMQSTKPKISSQPVSSETTVTTNPTDQFVVPESITPPITLDNSTSDEENTEVKPTVVDPQSNTVKPQTETTRPHTSRPTSRPTPPPSRGRPRSKSSNLKKDYVKKKATKFKQNTSRFKLFILNIKKLWKSFVKKFKMTKRPRRENEHTPAITYGR